MKYFVISDVHSHYTEMMTALSGTGFDVCDSTHKIVLVGDAFDRGDESYKVLTFLKEMVEREKLIWVTGNHELYILKRFLEGRFPSYRDTYKTFYDIAAEFSGKMDLTDSEVFSYCRAAGLEDLIKNNILPYYETQNYVFVHGALPSIKGEYNPDWRNTSFSSWTLPCMKNGMKSVMVDGLRVLDKTIVCGHSPAAYGNVRKDVDPTNWDDKKFDSIQRYKKDGSNKELYKPYYGDGVIGIDANCYKTSFVNCIVVEDGGLDGK